VIGGYIPTGGGEIGCRVVLVDLLPLDDCEGGYSVAIGAYNACSLGRIHKMSKL
jgi:hypothetical protein